MMHLNLRYSVFYLHNLGRTHLVTGQCEKAIATLKQVLTRNPNLLAAHFNLAICYAELGRQEEARAEVAEILRLNPNASVETYRQNIPYKDPAVLERTLAALRHAGLK
jgi:adenylate cyclase